MLESLDHHKHNDVMIYTTTMTKAKCCECFEYLNKYLLGIMYIYLYICLYSSISYAYMISLLSMVNYGFIMVAVRSNNCVVLLDNRVTRPQHDHYSYLTLHIYIYCYWNFLRKKIHVLMIYMAVFCLSFSFISVSVHIVMSLRLPLFSRCCWCICK